MPGKFVIRTSSNSQFYFNLHAANGERIFTSELYLAKAGATNGIAAVKTNAPYDSRYDRKNPSAGQFYFLLKAANGETLGRSEMYTTSAAMETGIASVKTNAPSATIDDLSGT
jgi:uncharacterized protein